MGFVCLFYERGPGPFVLVRVVDKITKRIELSPLFPGEFIWVEKKRR